MRYLLALTMMFLSCMANAQMPSYQRNWWTTNVTQFNGQHLTNLNASQLTSGTVADARLSTNAQQWNLPLLWPAYCVVEGDSLSTDTGVFSWRETLVSKYPEFTNYTWFNNAASGRSISNMLYEEYTNTVQAYKPAGGTNAYLFIFGGVADMVGVPKSAATMIPWLSNYYRVAKADGFSVVAFTIPNSTNTSAGFDSTLATMNNFIRSSDQWDYLVDVNALMPNAADNFYFNLDGVHLESRGKTNLADRVRGVLSQRAKTQVAISPIFVTPTNKAGGFRTPNGIPILSADANNTNVTSHGTFSLLGQAASTNAYFGLTNVVSMNGIIVVKCATNGIPFNTTLTNPANFGLDMQTPASVQVIWTNIDNTTNTTTTYLVTPSAIRLGSNTLQTVLSGGSFGQTNGAQYFAISNGTLRTSGSMIMNGNIAIHIPSANRLALGNGELSVELQNGGTTYLWVTNGNVIASGSITATNGGTFGAPVLSTSTSTSAPAATEFATAGWVRGLLDYGTIVYGTTVPFFTNDTGLVLYEGWATAPSETTNNIPVLTNGQYLMTVTTTNRYTTLNGLVTFEIRLNKIAGGTFKVSPEIYYSYDLTNLTELKAATAQTIDTTTNNYPWVCSFPSQTFTNTGAYIIGRLKVMETNAPATSVRIHIGTNSHMMLQVSGSSVGSTDYGLTNTLKAANNVWSGSNWFSGGLAAANIDSGTFAAAQVGNFTNHNDYTVSALTAGNVIAWSGTAWTNGPPAAGVGGADGQWFTNDSTPFGISNNYHVLLQGGLRNTNSSGSYSDLTNGSLTLYTPNNVPTAVISNSIVLSNSTPASGANPQYSPAIVMWGNASNTVASGPSVPTGARIYVKPEEGNPPANGQLMIDLGATNNNSVNWKNALQLTWANSAGGHTAYFGGALRTGGQLILGNGGPRINQKSGDQLYFLNANQNAPASFQYYALAHTNTTGWKKIDYTYSGQYLNNNSLGGTLTNMLPSATVGLHYYAVVMAAQTFLIHCNTNTGPGVGTDIIQYGTTTSTAGGWVSNNVVGSVVHLFCPVAGYWYCDDIVGTWGVY